MPNDRIIVPTGLNVSGALTPAQLAAAEKAQEREELNAEIAGRLNLYAEANPGAPVCDSAMWQSVEPVETRHHGVLQMPAWSYGRCIGPACSRFLDSLGVCGRVVNDLAAAVSLGLMTAEAARLEVAGRTDLLQEEADNV